MNVMVFDVPAESGGALSILSEFYNEVKTHTDKDINWIFVLSKPVFNETENIKILRFPWLKKSWIHRLYFDQFIAPRLVEKYNANKVFSLQNVIVPKTKVAQTVYIHQTLPFIDLRFKFRENKLFWIYQNIIGKSIIKSIHKTDRIIVQTKWFKKLCIEKTGVKEEKFTVVPPQINIKIQKYFELDKKSHYTFFYPAGSSFYKNHKIIVDACINLKKTNMNFKVVFTLKGDENEQISNLFNEVKNNRLPIEFIGNISREEVFDYYTKSILVFPSFIETFGLPLLEAKLHRSIILASDCPFSHEILDGYENVYYFPPFNADKLAYLMSKIIIGELNYIPPNNEINPSNTIQDRLIDYLITSK